MLKWSDCRIPLGFKQGMAEKSKTEKQSSKGVEFRYGNAVNIKLRLYLQLV